jgi:hypothetical protein
MPQVAQLIGGAGTGKTTELLRLMDGVEYRTIAEYPGYRFGSDGSVWSRWTRLRDAEYRVPGECFVSTPTAPWRKLREKLLRRWGYLFVILKDARGQLVSRRINRLICEAFHGAPVDGANACHNNGVKTDNRAGNLRWDSQQENIADRKRHGTHLSGHKLSPSQVAEIRALHATGRYRQQDLAGRFSVHRSTISYVVNHKTWKGVA